MTDIRVSQGQKVAIVNGIGEAPSKVSQAAKIMLFSPGSSPLNVSQAALVMVFTPDPNPPPVVGDGRRRGFMSFAPG